jgi:selenocysteine-specific translation elongation factor
MHHIVAVPIDKSLAEFIGKKGSENGITFFNRKSGDDVIVALAPTNTEEKPYGLAEALLLSEQIVLSTANVDKQFGEALVACSLLEKPVLLTDENDVSSFISGEVLAKYEVVNRSELLNKISQVSGPESNGMVRVDIDHAFPVNGVGTVALGIVTSGTVKTHDNLFHTSGKKVLVRSMQSQDADVNEAGPQTRVGLALKGIEHDEIEKGDIVSTKEIKKLSSVKATIKTSKIAKEEINDTNLYLLVSKFSHTNARLTKEGDGFSVSFEKPIPILPGDQFLLIRNQKPRIFALGTVKSV